MKPEHLISRWTKAEPLYRVHCSHCGWVAPLKATEADAFQEANYHTMTTRHDTIVEGISRTLCQHRTHAKKHTQEN